MLQVFKIVVLCLICTVFTALFSTVLLTTVLFIIITALVYDFDFETPFERHAINKIKHAYLKVRNIYQIIRPTLNQSNHYIYTPNMSNVNKTGIDFDLSRFNRSGSVFSPISRIGGSASSRRLPKQTSTPLTRNSPWQKNISSPVKAMTFQSSTITRSPRYSLSSPNNHSNEVINNNLSPTVQTVAGPLLASTRFNINLGTYTDTKSPGLVNRVVQYHNEAQGSEAQTHQAKYSSPGQFPIVQLYKKKLPLLTRIPKRCTIRVAPPDCATYNSPEGNQILRESFVQRTTENNAQNETEINTKSVLDALKEISRKRIHANDDLDDLSKRQRKGSVSATSTDNTNKDGKRLREDTPPKPKGPASAISPSSNKPKKICVTNEIECSLSSSILMRLKGQKRKAGVTGESISNAVKQRKISNEGNHISRQTQTNMKTNDSKSVTHSTQTNFTEQQVQQSDRQPSFQRKSQTTPTKATEEKEYTGLQQILKNAKIKKKQYFEKSIEEIDEERSSVQFNESHPYKPLFNHEPMEIIMKNRLEVAMAALNGDNPEIIPLPKLTLTEMLEKNKELALKESGHTLKESKGLTSILSPKNKTKHDKHVSFDIPDNSKTETDSKTLENLTNVDNNTSIQSTSSETPATTSQITEKSPFGAQVSFGAITSTTVSNNTTPTPLVKDTLQPSTQFKIGDSKINFGVDTTPKSLAFPIPSSTSNLTSNTSTPSAGLTFGTPKPNLSFGVSSNNTTPTLSFGTNPPDLKVPNFLSTPSTTISITSTQSNITPNTSVVSFGASGDVSKPAAIPNNTLSFATPSTQQSTTFGTPQTVSFGTTTANSPAPMFSPPNQTAGTFGTPKSSGFSFGPKPPNETNSSAPTFNFGGAKTPPKTGGFKFDLGKPANPTKEPQNSTTFVESSKPPTFTFGPTNNNTALPPAFGATTASSAPALGGTVVTTAPPAFGGTPTTVPPAFGGAPTTAPPAFGGTPTTAPPTFGGTPTTAPPAFGGTQTTAPPAFGAVTTAQTPAFGSNIESKPVSLFGATTNNSTTSTPAFGSPAPTNTTTSSVFGSTSSAPTFGAAKTNENKPRFGFGAPTTQSGTFGSFSAPAITPGTGFAFSGTQPKPATTTAAPASSNTFTFGGGAPSNKPFTFNSTTTTTSNVFGGTNAPPAFAAPSVASGVFGGPTTTTTAGTFNTPNTTSQPSNVFGAPTTTASVFGASTTTTTANTFGQPSSGVFGGAAPSFGASSANGSLFGNQNNSNNNNTFGGTNPPNATFGAPNQAPFASGSGSTTSNVFAGNSGTQSNVFGSPPSTSKPAFGTPSAPSFGGTFGNTSTTTPAFGASPAPTNNNVFGSNSNQPASTFGATTNNNQPSSGGFGAFGATQPAPQGGVFAFGGSAPAAGSTNAFQFGGSTTPAKPSGFNFSANTTTPNLNFTAGTTTPNFTAAPAPNFGTPNPGMFNIGSGSTAAKQRPMIKARRRNN